MMASGSGEEAVMALLSMLLVKPHAKTTSMLAEELAKLPRGDYMWMNILLLHVYQALMAATATSDNAASTATVEQLVTVLDKALSICHIQTIQDSESQCFKLLQCLFTLLPGATEKVALCGDLTDESRLVVLHCIQTLVTAPSPLPFLATSVPFAAYMVSVLLFTSQKDPNRTCRVDALRTLTAVVRAIDDAAVLTQVFPGLMSSLFQIVQGDYKLGSKLPTQAIRCLAVTTKLVLQDSRCQALVSVPSYSLDFLDPHRPARPAGSVDPSSSPPPPTPSAAMRLDRSPAWLDATRTNVHTLVVFVCTHQRHHSNAAIRQALAGFCVDLLVHCRLTLSDCFIPCYETLLALAQDPIDVVRHVAADGVASVHALLSPSEHVQLHSNASERCMTHLDTLMKKCAAPSLEFEREAVATLQVCLGYVTTCQETWVVDTDRVLKAWTRVLAVDALDAHVLAYTTHAPECKVAYFRKRFEHFRSDETVAVALQVVRCFGATPAFLTFVDAIVAHVTLHPEDSMEWLIVLNQLVLGAARADLPTLSSMFATPQRQLSGHVGAYLIDVLLQLPLWTAPESCAESLSILVEIVGSIAQSLAASFRPLLMHVLYPLVEQLGRPSPVVRQAALATLERIAFFCSFDSSVPTLLQANMDYVVDMLVGRLSQLDEYPHTPFVVEGLLRHGGSSATSPLPLLEEAVAGVIRSVDFHVATPEHAIGLLRVMKAVVSNEPVQAPDKSKHPHNERMLSTWTTPSLRVTSFIHDMNNLFQPPDDDDIPTVSLEDDDNVGEASAKGAMPIEHNKNTDENVTTAPPTGMAKLVEDIVFRSTYFTAAPDTATACLAWQVLTQALAVVRPDHLRPLVHRIWPQLSKRVGDATHKPKHLAAVQCVSALADLCGDFICNRFVESVWPTFQAHFAHHAATLPTHGGAIALDDLKVVDLAGQDTTSALQRPTSLTNQIHWHMLVCLERLCRATDAIAFLVQDIADATQPFLAATSPPSLQDHAVSLFQALLELNADLLFPRLVSMAAVPLPPPPSDLFPAYAADAVHRIPDRVPQPALFARNGRHLLASCSG